MHSLQPDRCMQNKPTRISAWAPSLDETCFSITRSNIYILIRNALQIAYSLLFMAPLSLLAVLFRVCFNPFLGGFYFKDTFSS